jgi:hypothetical protein
MPGSGGKAVDQWWAGKMAASAEEMAKGPSDTGSATQDKGTGGTFLGLGHWGQAQPQAEALARGLNQAQQHFEAIVTGMKVAVQHKDSQSLLCVWTAVLPHCNFIDSISHCACQCQDHLARLSTQLARMPLTHDLHLAVNHVQGIISRCHALSKGALLKVAMHIAIAMS